MSYPSDQSSSPHPPNPFAPPGHQPPPQDPQAWAPVHQSGYAVPAPPYAPNQPYPPSQPYAQHQAYPPNQTYAPAPKGRNGLAIAALVMSGLALLTALGVAAFMAVGSVAAPSWVLQGEVAVIDKGVQAPVLEEALRSVIEDDGSSVGEIVCPARSAVGQGLVTVCHGSVDDWDWTGVVVFEDEAGTFIVNQL